MFQGAISNSGDPAPPPKQQPLHQPQPHGAEEERGRTESERTSGGNGWPRQETVALIKIRSDMDLAFRDATAKGPLWDEVARKLGDLGYHRSGKKCREKFENVYKYHKRTKEGRASKADGKTYRFFDQLEALQPTAPPPPTTVTPISVAPPADFPNMSASTSSSATSSSDEEPPEVRSKRKRKWTDFFGRLMKEVIHKQEELQMKFLDEIQKRDRERVAREEAWRMEEIAKMNREHDLLIQERSVAAAKDAAVITLLQKITQQKPPNADPKILQQPHNQPPSQPMQQQPLQNQVELPSLPKNLELQDVNGGGEINSNKLAPSPSRWPKAQVYALINLRTRLDVKYQDSGPKGPLWEEISAEMMKLGYDRSAKRCKEKWENINKYYKKVKESNKKRPEDSKTCPYFHQLDALYREKANNNHLRLRPDQMEPIMAEPEQQWPLPAALMQQQHHRPAIHQNHENIDQNNEDDYDDEDEDEGGDYEIVPNNNPSSMAAVTVTDT